MSQKPTETPEQARARLEKKRKQDDLKKQLADYKSKTSKSLFQPETFTSSGSQQKTASGKLQLIYIILVSP